MRMLLGALSILVFAGCASVKEAHVAAVADTGSTILALSQGAIELNPLGGSPIALVGMTVSKLALAEVVDDKRLLGCISGLWSGAALSNTLIAVAGAANPVAWGAGLVFLVTRCSIALRTKHEAPAPVTPLSIAQLICGPCRSLGQPNGAASMFASYSALASAIEPIHLEPSSCLDLELVEHRAQSAEAVLLLRDTL